MNKNLVFKYLTSAVNRMELIGRHLRGEMIDTQDSESIVIAESSVDLSDQELGIISFFLEEIAISNNRLKELVEKLKQDN